VLRWWFLCAIEEDCIAPTKDILCKFRGLRKYAHCHRYDQSAINILLANYFNDDYSAYLLPGAHGPMLSVERMKKDTLDLSLCDSKAGVTRTTSRILFKDIASF